MSRAFTMFRSACLIGGCLVAAAVPGTAEAQVGSPAPEFQCRDDQGNIWDSRNHVGKKLVVVYFYPSDFAFCCTRQAQRYRDRLCELEMLGAEVVGISGDSVESHEMFASEHKLNFRLLSDPKGDLARQFGVPLRAGGKSMANVADGRRIGFPRDVTTARWTMIIDTDGRVIYREADVNPIGDTRLVLEFLCRWNASPAANAEPVEPIKPVVIIDRTKK